MFKLEVYFTRSLKMLTPNPPSEDWIHVLKAGLLACVSNLLMSLPRKYLVV